MALTVQEQYGALIIREQLANDGRVAAYLHRMLRAGLRDHPLGPNAAAFLDRYSPLRSRLIEDSPTLEERIRSALRTWACTAHGPAGGPL